MTIIFNDGGYATCSTIEFYGDEIMCDGYRFVKISEINYIEDDTEEEKE